MQFGTREAAEQMQASLSSIGVDADIVPIEKEVPPQTIKTTTTGGYEFAYWNGDHVETEWVPANAEVTETREGYT